MWSIKNLLRRLFTLRGLELRHISTPTARSADFFANRAARNALSRPTSIHVFDDDPRLQGELIRSFGPARVCFHPCESPLVRPSPRRTNMGFSAPGRFWVVLNADRYSLRGFLEQQPWARFAALLLLRCSVASLRAQTDVLGTAIGICGTHGLYLFDLFFHGQPVNLNADNAQILLLFSRTSLDSERPVVLRDRIQRLDEGLSFIPSPLAQQEKFRWLTGRGSFGFCAGVFNPGALLDAGQLMILARGEQIPWPQQELNERSHFSGWCPLLLRLDSSCRVAAHTKLRFEGPFVPSRFRIEDFRLLKHEDGIISNFSIITLPDERAALDRRVRLGLQRSRVGLCSLSCESGTLRFIGFPRLDFAHGPIEKNWAMFINDQGLNLIYSISPYRVLRAVDWPGLTFKTEVRCPLRLPFAQGDLFVRNSINPVEYDERHFLHLVHKVYPSKQYVYWALLIDKKTLRPAFVSNGPIIRGGTSLSAAIVYVCSAVALHDRVLLFAGINDCGSGVWDVERSKLDACWRALPSN
jgi:hypothetical protein